MKAVLNESEEMLKEALLYDAYYTCIQQKRMRP